MFFSRYTQFVQSQGLKDSQCIVFAHHQPSAPDLAKSYLRKYAGPSRFYNVAIKAVEFQPSNLLTSLVFSIILC